MTLYILWDSDTIADLFNSIAIAWQVNCVLRKYSANADWIVDKEKAVDEMNIVLIGMTQGKQDLLTSINKSSSQHSPSWAQWQTSFSSVCIDWKYQKHFTYKA